MECGNNSLPRVEVLHHLFAREVSRLRSIGGASIFQDNIIVRSKRFSLDVSGRQVQVEAESTGQCRYMVRLSDVAQPGVSRIRIGYLLGTKRVWSAEFFGGKPAHRATSAKAACQALAEWAITQPSIAGRPLAAPAPCSPAPAFRKGQLVVAVDGRYDARVETCHRDGTITIEQCFQLENGQRTDSGYLGHRHRISPTLVRAAT